MIKQIHECHVCLNGQWSSGDFWVKRWTDLCFPLSPPSLVLTSFLIPSLSVSWVSCLSITGPCLVRLWGQKVGNLHEMSIWRVNNKVLPSYWDAMRKIIKEVSPVRYAKTVHEPNVKKWRVYPIDTEWPIICSFSFSVLFANIKEQPVTKQDNMAPKTYIHYLFLIYI